MNAPLIIFVCLLWWSVIGAILLASLQDAYIAPDHRDPTIGDLPLWQVLVCGPVAWVLRIKEGRR